MPCRFFATILGAVPNFWLATLLVMLFTLRLRWLPPGGFTPFFVDPLTNLKQMIMPALSLGLVSSALLIRIMRASMIEVLSQRLHPDGRSPRERADGIVIRRHALRNALIPYINVAAVEFGFLFGSVVIIEDIFLLPGRRLAGARRHHQPRLSGAACRRADDHGRSCWS